MTVRLNGGVTPTMLRVLRRCSLRMAFALSGAGRAPSTPASRLGTAAHEVLAAVANGDLPDAGAPEFAGAVEAVWLAAVDRQAEESATHEVEAAFGPPAAWPSFNDVASRVQAEARALSVEGRSWQGRTVMVEHTIRRDGEAVWGTPDLVVGQGGGEEGFVADHKTGVVSDADVDVGGDVRAQLLVYAYLARLDGIEVGVAEARPVARPRHRVAVDWTEAEAVVEEARGLADAFNAAIAAGWALELGKPSEEACGRCPYAAECPAVWSYAAPGALGALQFVLGKVLNVEHNGRGLVLLELEATAGTVPPGRVTVTRLPVRRLPALLRVSVGDDIRLAGLAGEPDSRLLHADRGMWPRLSTRPLRPSPGAADALSS
jgi:hypothetical protein